MYNYDKIGSNKFKKILNNLNDSSISLLYVSANQHSIIVLMKNEEGQECCMLSSDQTNIDNKLEEGWSIIDLIVFIKPTENTKTSISEFLENNIEDDILKQNKITIFVYDEYFGKIYSIIEDSYYDRDLDSKWEDNYNENDENYSLEDEYEENESYFPKRKKFNNEDIDDYERQGVYLDDVLNDQTEEE